MKRKLLHRLKPRKRKKLKLNLKKLNLRRLRKHQKNRKKQPGMRKQKKILFSREQKTLT